MPIYEYRCTSCGHQQEFLRKVSDAPITVCTQCGKPTFSKMLTAAGFQLKGSGWYATDFKNSGARPAAAASTPASGTKAGEGSQNGGAEASKGTSTSEGAASAPATTPAKAAPAPKSDSGGSAASK